MEGFLTAFLNGLFMGAVYASFALAISLVFGVMKIINFFHCSLITAGMYGIFFMWSWFRLEPYVGVLIVVPILFLGGYVLHNTFVLTLFKRERAYVVEPISVLMLTAGMWLVLDNLWLLIFGSQFRAVKSFITGSTTDVAGITISNARFVAFVGGLALTYALWWFLNNTRVGKGMRATAQNREAAALCGVNIYRMYNLAFGLGAAVTAVGAALLMPFYYVDPYVGFSYDMKSFIIVVLGGMGSIPGTLVGGLIVGVVEAVTTQFVSGTYAGIAVFLVFVACLLFRPQGLLGRETV